MFNIEIVSDRYQSPIPNFSIDFNQKQHNFVKFYKYFSVLICFCNNTNHWFQILVSVLTILPNILPNIFPLKWKYCPSLLPKTYTPPQPRNDTPTNLFCEREVIVKFGKIKMSIINALVLKKYLIVFKVNIFRYVFVNYF